MGERKLEEIVWHEITGTPGDEHPDAELEVLVFDGDLNDTVKAALGFDEDSRPIWIEQVTDQSLPNPQWWCEVPFPGANPVRMSFLDEALNSGDGTYRP